MTYGDSKEEVVSAALDTHKSAAESLQAGLSAVVEDGGSHGSVFGDMLGLLSSLACGFYEVSLNPNSESLMLRPPKHAFHRSGINAS
jgi:hypothetical protein